MTYFLRETAQPFTPQVPDVAPTGMLEGLGAAFQKAALENDANLRVRRESAKEETEVVRQAFGLIGEKETLSFLKERGMVPDTLETINPDLLRYNGKAREAFLGWAREKAEADPGAWQGVDLSQEGMDTRINTRLQAEHRDLEQALSAMPGSRELSEFVGGMAGITADIKNLPFLLPMFGGGTGSILKIFAREAAMNTAAEAVNMPAQFSMAERLDIPDPNVPQQLATAAIAGGIIGIAGEGIRRGLSYFAGRNEVRVPEGANPTTYEAQVEAAEDALSRGDNPLDAVMDVMRGAEPEPAPAPAREPLIPRSVTATTPEPTPLAPEPVTTEVLPPREGEAPQTDGEMAAMAERALNDADALRQGAVGNRRFPFLNSLKKAGVRINPDSPEGQELKAMGINARTMPGLFSRKATGERTALDTLVASEWDELYPGLWDATGTPRDTSAPGGLYLNRDGVFEVIRREAAGDLSWIRDVADADAMARGADDVLRGAPRPDTTEIEDFTSGARAEGGFYFPEPNPFGDDFRSRMDEARSAIGEFSFRNGIRDLMPQDIEEIARELAEYGGDGKFLIERAINREIGEIEARYGGRDGAEGTAGGVGREGEPPAGAVEPVGAGPDAAGGRAVEPQGTERTSAGVQYVAPGIAPVSERARLEAVQSRPMRGGQRPMDDGLFDVAGRAQMDMFSDPVDPKARPIQDAMMEDLRDAIDTDGDFTVDLMDGRGERPVSSLLDELEQDDEFNAILDACGKPRSE